MKKWKVYFDITGFYPKRLTHAAETEGGSLDTAYLLEITQHGIPADSQGDMTDR